VPGQTGARGVGLDALRIVIGQEQLADRSQVQGGSASHRSDDLHA
jgi:hypothetical protein